MVPSPYPQVSHDRDHYILYSYAISSASYLDSASLFVGRPRPVPTRRIHPYHWTNPTSGVSFPCKARSPILAVSNTSGKGER